MAYELAQERTKFETDKKNYENEIKSAGSRKTAGEKKEAKDPIVDDWYNNH
jgi:uncharacterized membrane protein